MLLLTPIFMHYASTFMDYKFYIITCLISDTPYDNPLKKIWIQKYNVYQRSSESKYPLTKIKFSKANDPLLNQYIVLSSLLSKSLIHKSTILLQTFINVTILFVILTPQKIKKKKLKKSKTLITYNQKRIAYSNENPTGTKLKLINKMN